MTDSWGGAERPYLPTLGAGPTRGHRMNGFSRSRKRTPKAASAGHRR